MMMKKHLIIVFILFSNSLIYSQDNTDNSNALYKKGVEFFNNSDFVNAKELFEQSFKKNPEFKTYGMYVITISKLSHGVEMTKNVKIFPFTQKLKELNKIKNSYFFNVLNDSYLFMEKNKINEIRYDEMDLIATDITRIIDKKYNDNPNAFSTNLNKGFSLIMFNPKLYISQKDNSSFISVNGNNSDAYKAHKYFDNLIKIRPESETGYFYSAYTNYEGDIPAFKKALKLNPKLVLANVFITEFQKGNEFSGIVENLIRFFEIKPNEVIESIKIDGSELDMLFLYVKVYTEINEQSLYKHMSRDRDINYTLSRLLYEKKDTDVINLCSKKINELKISGNKNQIAKLLYYRGIANFNILSYGTAIEDFNSLIEMNPSISDAYGMRGAVKTLSNDYELALLDLNKAIELEPNDGYMYFYRGIVNKKLGKTDESCSDYNKSKELGFENMRLIFFFENCK